ncbi:MAG: NUDIX hydrolase [Ideonella sp.]|nr:NUDIX hydrolase [Ideonella sp.]MCC7457215.1 NUDIX hydrolase [Nitrospira sp.]
MTAGPRAPMQALALPAARSVVTRSAATTLVLRDSARGPEVLMVKRSLQASFMPGAYVFPGGAVDAQDGAREGDEPHAALVERIGRITGVGERAPAFAAAALRECREECHLDLGSTAVLRPWSRWVTPLGVPKRFDTVFFVAPAPAGQVPRPDAGETTVLEWIAPAVALQAHAAGTMPMEFATVATVRSLLPFAARDVASVLAHAVAQRSLRTVHPRLQLDAARRVVGLLLPGEPGYDELAGDGP